MKPDYHLPRLDGRDAVAEIRRKRENARRKKARTHCLGTGSCDCPRCLPY